MTIVRGPRPQSGFAMLDNDVLQDPRLSYRARGVLAAILSRPDSWRTDADSLAREGKEGRAAILTALRELADAGYVERTRIQDRKTGRWSTTSTVFDRPKLVGVSATEVRFPNVGLPNVGYSDSLESNRERNPLTPTSGGKKSCSKHRRAKDYCPDCDRVNLPPMEIPDWCGSCDSFGESDPYARWVEIADDEGNVRVAKCPTCYPRRSA